MQYASVRDSVSEEEAEQLLDALSASHLPVSKVITKKLISCVPETPLYEAAEIMRQESCSSIMILQDNSVCGIWTEADAAKVDFTNSHEYLQPVKNVMSAPVKTVPSNMRMCDVALSFRKEGLRHFLVVDGDNQPFGMVSQTDIVLTPGIEQFLRMQLVKSVIHKPPVMLSEETALSKAVIQMRRRRATAIIVEYHNDSYGIITERDIVGFVASKLDETCIGDVATRPLKIIKDRTSLYHARNILIESHIRHIGVVNDSGKIVGLISFAEILSSMELIYVQELKSALKGRLTALKAAKSNLYLAQRVIESSPDGVIITDKDGLIISVNPGFTRATGYSQEEVVGKNPSVLSSGRHDKEFYKTMWKNLLVQGFWQGEIYNRRKNGEVYPEFLTINRVSDDNGVLTNYAAIFSDLSELKKSEQRIKELAYYDSLTHLPNKQLLEDRLSMAITTARTAKKRIVLALFDLDRLERINDSLGNRAGDEVLKITAQRMTRALGDHQTFAHIGSDKFALLVPDVVELDDTLAHIGQLLSIYGEPVIINGNELFISASAGISIFPDDCSNADDLFQKANMALHRAKAQGGNCYELHSAELTDDLQRYLEVENDLRRAISNQEFYLLYQPIYKFPDETLVGFEALIRWDESSKGIINPDDFIPIAEESGLIISLGDWVLKKACEDIAMLVGRFGEDYYVTVNISAKQFHDEGFVSKVKHFVKQFDIPITCLRFELTESLLLEDSDEILERLDTLRSMGIEFLLDDFGTGYSSLGYLQRFPINCLKLDRSFVQDIATNTTNYELVKAMISMAHALGLQTVAEGIEDANQADLLKVIGCDNVQGYYYGRPEALAKQFTEEYLGSE